MTNMTTTLEKSKELKLAGWNKPTKFYHANIFNRWEVIANDNNFMEYGCEKIPAPTITELLEDLHNIEIESYNSYISQDFFVAFNILDLFRSPDKLVDCWIWAKK